jgi:hypothetical protein
MTITTTMMNASFPDPYRYADARKGGQHTSAAYWKDNGDVCGGGGCDDGGNVVSMLDSRPS